MEEKGSLVKRGEDAKPSIGRAKGAYCASADDLDGSPISTTPVETKLPGEGGVGGRGGRMLTIFLALRLAWRKLRKYITFALP